MRTVIERLNLPCIAMESFGASTRNSLDVCKTNVQECDIFAIIIGHRYGAVDKSKKISFTETEYRLARELNRSILPYIKSDGALVLPEYVERSTDGNKRLAKFRKELCSHHTASFFSTRTELAVQFAIDLSDLARRWTSEKRTKDTFSPSSSRTFDGQPRNHKNVVVTSNRYGDIPEGLNAAITAAKFSPKFIEKNELITEEQLKNAGILVLPAEGYARLQQFADNEIQAMVDFISAGGGLLCGGQAWSWAYSSYGNRPIEDFPLNRLGESLGFRVSANSIGDVKPGSANREVFGQISKWEGFGKWIPSRIDASNANAETILKDTEGRTIAIRGKLGDGKFVAMGHSSILSYNPSTIGEVLKYLQPK